MSSLKKHIQVSHPAEYETEVKTNVVDLNDCKELIPDGQEPPIALEDEEEEGTLDEEKPSQCAKIPPTAVCMEVPKAGDKKRRGVK